VNGFEFIVIIRKVMKNKILLDRMKYCNY